MARAQAHYGRYQERFEMSDDSSKPKKLSLSGGKLTLGNIDASKLRTGPSVGGARKTVQVEVRRKRAPVAPGRGSSALADVVKPDVPTAAIPPVDATSPAADDRLTAQERAARVRALKEGLAKTEIPTETPEHTATDDAQTAVDNDGSLAAEDVAAKTKKVSSAEVPTDPIATRRAAELAELQEIEASEERRRTEENKKHADARAVRNQAITDAPRDTTPVNKFGPTPTEVQTRRRREAEEMAPRRPAPRREVSGRRQSGKMTITQALSGDDNRRQRSLASVKRQRERARMREEQPQVKQVRDVVIPDNITVGELANRMAERTADVVKELMKIAPSAGCSNIPAPSISNRHCFRSLAYLIRFSFSHKLTWRKLAAETLSSSRWYAFFISCLAFKPSNVDPESSRSKLIVSSRTITMPIFL